MTAVERVELAITIKDAGIPVSDAYIYEISGVRKPESDEVVSKAIVPPDLNTPPDPNTPDPANPAPDPANPDSGKTIPPTKKDKVQASLLGKAFSFFVKALSRERAPLDF